jgi:AcrR family transcriptional regulator
MRTQPIFRRARLVDDGRAPEETDMSNKSTGSNGRVPSATERGDATRERLLDALESIAADEGLAALSHRAIARRASLHTGLIHYHFGTVDRLLDEAIARRAQRFAASQLAALSALFARGRWTVEDVVTALWQPFAALGRAIEQGWRNYLCLVARLAGDGGRDQLLARHFRDVGVAARDALRAALPAASDDAISAGLRFIRTLFEQETLARCRMASLPGRTAGSDQQLTRFAAAGLRGLAGESPAGTPSRVAAD